MKKIKLICFGIMCLFMMHHAQSQSIPLQLDSLLNVTLDSMRTSMNIKSLSAAMQFPDTSIWSRATGVSSINPAVNVTTDDVYEIGSVTKTMTSACVLQLADQGILSLDDSLFEWLDTIQYINPDITIRQLLSHQSGIYDVLNNTACQPALLANPDSIWDMQNLISSFILPPLFQAGANWSYSNTNYFLLGMIIEAATGNPYYVELRNRFFSPLGLSTISIPSFEVQNSPVAHVWLDINGDGITDDAHQFFYYWTSLNSTAGAAGGYYATPTDIAKWIRSYMREDLLSAAIMSEAKTTVYAPGTPGNTYGLGLMTKYFLGIQGFGHGGDLAYSASSWYFPGKDLSITVHGNDADKNSWTLLPVVTALLRTYTQWLSSVTSVADNFDRPVLMNAYPNPFHDGLNVQLHCNRSVENAELVLTNSIGQNISSIHLQNLSEGENNVAFNDLENLSSGFYLLSVIMDGRTVQTMKVIK